MTETASTKPADALRVPNAMLPIVEPMGQWIDTFCRVTWTRSNALLSRKMLTKLARKRPSPLERGDLLIWAASVVWSTS